MNILYGIQLNGNGHLTRSLEVINKLKERGHSVDIVTSGGNSNLSIDLEHKHFKGLDLFLSKMGSVDWFKTIKTANIIQLIKDTNLDVSSYDLVISDFEPISAWSAHKSGIKSIGISNQSSIINQPVETFKDFVYRKFIRLFAPCDDYIKLSYQISEEDMFYPIVSKELLNKTKSNNTILVYLPNYTLDLQLQVFDQFKKYKFIIYSNEDCETNKHITLKKHDRKSFIKDMTKCRSVITAGGFTTTTEALVLGKKLWSIPLKDHYEQLVNSKSLENIGVFTGDFDKSNFEDWENKFSTVDYRWSDPIPEIIKKIESYES